MNNNFGLVSILMNAYNSERFLQQAINSVYSQTYSNWEIIFIDNCSTDSTSEIISKYDTRIKYYKTNSNIPLGLARNFGLKFCTGEFIAFLDTDDMWESTKLEIQINEHRKFPNAKMSYTGGVYIDESNQIIKKFTPKITSNVFSNLLDKYEINLQTVIIKSDVNLKFDSTKLFCEDFDAFMKIASKYAVLVLEDQLVSYRIHSNSLTFLLKERWHIEFRETLEDIAKSNPILYLKFKNKFKKSFAKADYYEARYLKEDLNKSYSSFRLLFSNSLIDFRYFILSFIFLLPNNIWYKVRKIIQN